MKTGYRAVFFFQAAWRKLTDMSAHIAAIPTGIRENKRNKSNLEDDRVIKENSNYRESSVELTYKQLTAIIVDDFPEGFPRLGYLQSSNQSFAIYRVFRYLSARVLVHKEGEMNDLEKQLAEQDSADEKSDLTERKNRLRSVKYSMGTQTIDPGRVRDSANPELIQVVYEKLKEYCE